MIRKIALVLMLVLAGSLVACTSKDKGAAVSDGKGMATGASAVIVKGSMDLESQTIVIAETSDLHGRIYPYDYAIDGEDVDTGLAKIATIVNELRAKTPSLILVDNGDTVQDNYISLFNDQEVSPMVEAMNAMGFDAWNIGNHEFNFEKSFLDRNVKNFDGAVLSNNVIKTDDGSYFVKPYQIFDVNGARVAIVAGMVPYVPIWEASTPEHFEGLKFDGIIESTKVVMAEIEGQYDVLVGLFHVGREDERGGDGIYDIANAFPEFDVIFAGHEHGRFTEVVNGVPIIEPGFAGWALATASIDVEKVNGKWVVKDVSVANLETANVEPDGAVLAQFKYVDDKSKSVANTVVGEVAETFIKRPDYITGKDDVTTMPTAQLEPNAVIDLINDVQLFYSGADIAAAAFFKSNANLMAGDFKNKDVANIYKYPNTLIGVEISGANLKQFMEWSASYYNTWEEGDVTISFNKDVRSYNYDMFTGIDYEIDLSKGAGERIVNATIDGKPLDITATYKLAVNNYRFGTLTQHGWVTNNNKYYDSYEEMQDAGRIRDLIVKYTKEERKGKLEPIVHNNWKITGVKLDYPQAEKIYEMVRAGDIVIPRSEDGRTPNVRSLNIKDYPNL